MDAGGGGGGPGHSSVQPVNGGGKNVVRLNGEQQLLQEEVNIEGDDLEGGRTKSLSSSGIVAAGLTALKSTIKELT
jgi:hypothetical protein